MTNFHINILKEDLSFKIRYLLTRYALFILYYNTICPVVVYIGLAVQYRLQ